MSEGAAGSTRRSRRLLAALILLSLAGAWSYSWTYTPHGRLDYRAALSLRLLTLPWTVRPDPESDFEVPLRLNLIFVLSMLLPQEEVSRVEDVAIPTAEVEVPARVYWPSTAEDAAVSLPVIVYFHGGGFALGNVDQFDALARSLANAAPAVVVSVDYRLAPAHPFPSALEDCYAALEWVADHAGTLGADASKLVVAGDSAGGNLATVVALKARDEGGPSIAGQVLYYPATDLTDRHYRSVDDFADGYGTSSETSAAFNQAYVGLVDDKADPYISPLYASSLADLPPALVVTAGFDRLTDSARAYVARLRQSGVAVTHRHYPTVFHGFMSIRLFPQRREALSETGEFFRELFGKDAS